MVWNITVSNANRSILSKRSTGYCSAAIQLRIPTAKTRRLSLPCKIDHGSATEMRARCASISVAVMPETCLAYSLTRVPLSKLYDAKSANLGGFNRSKATFHC